MDINDVHNLRTGRRYVCPERVSQSEYSEYLSYSPHSINLSLAAGAALDGQIVAVLDPRGSAIIGGAGEIGVVVDDLNVVIGGAGDVAVGSNLNVVVGGAMLLSHGAREVTARCR